MCICSTHKKETQILFQYSIITKNNIFIYTRKINKFTHHLVHALSFQESKETKYAISVIESKASFNPTFFSYITGSRITDRKNNIYNTKAWRFLRHFQTGKITTAHYHHFWETSSLPVSSMLSSDSKESPARSVLIWHLKLAGITSKYRSYCWSSPKYESDIKYKVRIIRPAKS